MENDELRWRREQERHRDERVHDLKKHWSGQRLEVYSECLEAFEMWLDILKEEHNELRAADGDDALGLRNRAARLAVKAAVDQIHIVGSDEAIEAALRAYGKFHRYHHRVDIGREPGWMPNEPATRRQSSRCIFGGSAVFGLLNSADLGADCTSVGSFDNLAFRQRPSMLAETDRHLSLAEPGTLTSGEECAK